MNSAELFQGCGQPVMQSLLIAGKRLNELGGLLGHPIWRVDLGAHTVRQPIAHALERKEILCIGKYMAIGLGVLLQLCFCLGTIDVIVMD